jgi:hypothetical protein
MDVAYDFIITPAQSNGADGPWAEISETMGQNKSFLLSVFLGILSWCQKAD